MFCWWYERKLRQWVNAESSVELRFWLLSYTGIASHPREYQLTITESIRVVGDEWQPAIEIPPIYATTRLGVFRKAAAAIKKVK